MKNEIKRRHGDNSIMATVTLVNRFDNTNIVRDKMLKRIISNI